MQNPGKDIFGFSEDWGVSISQDPSHPEMVVTNCCKVEQRLRCCYKNSIFLCFERILSPNGIDAAVELTSKPLPQVTTTRADGAKLTHESAFLGV